MTAAPAGAAPSEVIAEWRNHTSMTKQVAARLAHEMSTRPPGTRVESSEKIAARYGVSPAMATKARMLLHGQKIIHKAGRHYYTGPPGL